MLEIIGLALQAGSAIFGAVAGERAAGKNRDMARRAADDVLARGEEDVLMYQRSLAQLMGRQRTASAAQGIDLNQGTAATIASQTTAIGEQDVATIRKNAQREAWGIRTQANINYNAARNQAIGAGIGALGMVGGTLLGNVSNPWTSYVGGKGSRMTTKLGG